MRSYLVLLLALLLSINASAQLEVKEGSFKEVPGFVNINPDENYQFDDNDLPYAVIKIRTENINDTQRKQLKFSGNAGTFIVLEYKDGEVWVYLTAKYADYLKISHPDLSSTEFTLPYDLVPKKGYEMTLVNKAYMPIIQAKDQLNYLIVKTDQPNAMIYIDNKYISDGEAAKSYKIGETHQWRIECDLYHTESGSATIVKGEPVTVEKKLRPAYGYLNITSEPENGAAVFLDNKRVGETPYKTDKLSSGDHKVKLVKEMFNTAEKVFTVTDGSTIEAKMAMTPNFASVNVTTDSQSDIYIDNELKGKGSWKGRLSDGEHIFEAKKASHTTQVKVASLVIGKNDDIIIPNPTPIFGTLDINSSPMGASIIIDGKNYGVTPQIISDILIGNHEIRLEKTGYTTFKKSITLDEANTLSINEKIMLSSSEKPIAENMSTQYPIPHNVNLERGALYVSKNTGNNRGDGSKKNPYKNIQKAIDVAPEGATIYVAEGNYFGTLDCGNINVTKCVKIYGGYNTDFSERDILKYRTMVQPTAESNGTAKGGGTMNIKVYNPNGEIIIDGLLFDRGNSISYNARGEGQPQGVESPMMNPIGTAGKGGANLEETGVLTTETRELYFDNPNFKSITIRNCAFVNAPNYGVGGMFQGEVTIDNCIFVNCRMIACDVMGSNGQNYQTVHFTNNTVLFTWSRLKDFDDMGYGFRYNNGTHSYVDHCIIGCCIYAGLDRCRLDYKDKEAQKIATTTNNMFFLNRRADALIAGKGKFLMISVDQFEEAEPLTDIDGCFGMFDMKIFNGKINEAYLKGFANATYKTSVDYKPSSADNKLRAALGLNKQGTINSSSSMFANRYPFEDALKLFGAVQGYGAQMPK